MAKKTARALNIERIRKMKAGLKPKEVVKPKEEPKEEVKEEVEEQPKKKVKKKASKKEEE